MITKKTTEANDGIKISINRLRRLLVNDKETAYKIRFKRYGRKYVITNTSAGLDQKLEDSFNTFMNKLEVKKDGDTLRGIMFLGRNTEDFNICYQKDHEGTLHQIKGKLG
jgi:hypothetical protein